MQRHLKIPVDDWIYWGVVSRASDEHRSQGEILHELIGEALRARAIASAPLAKPATLLDETIAQAAGLVGISFEDMKMKLLSLGWWTFVDDLEEEARQEAEAAA